MEPADVASVYVSADGPEGARLEERSSSGEDPWRVVCTLPCSAWVVPWPAAEHRIVDDERGRGGTEVVRIGRDDVRVTYSRGQPAAQIVGRVAGTGIIVVGGLGLLLGTAGMLAGMYTDSSGADARETSGLLLLGGAASVAVGALVLVRTGELGRPSVEVRTRGDRAESARHRPDAPPLPRLYATVLDVRF